MGRGGGTPHIPVGTKTRPAADTTPGSDISSALHSWGGVSFPSLKLNSKHPSMSTVAAERCEWLDRSGGVGRVGVVRSCRGHSPSNANQISCRCS